MTATDHELSAVSPFSGKPSNTVWGKKSDKAIFRCSETSALFFDRTAGQVEDYEDYYAYLKEFDDARFGWEMKIRRSKFHKQLALMEEYVRPGKLLDIGSGVGYFCRVAQERNWQAKGVEVCEEARKYGSRVFGVHYTTLETTETASLDAITCHHVLEHIEQPAGFLSRVRRKLKPGGLLAIHVPHQQPLTFLIRNRLQKIFNPYSETFCCLYGDIHISGFDKSSLKCFVESCGFETQFVRSIGMWSKFYDPFFFRNFVRERQWGALGKKLIRHTLEIGGIPLGMGDWVVGYFRKPARK